MSISQSASRCIRLLEGLTATTSAQLQQELENTTVRFRIWAGDVGIFVPGIGSLDYRLQDKSEVLDVMLVLFDQLGAVLENATPPPCQKEKSENDDSGQTVEKQLNSFDSSSTPTLDIEHPNKSVGWTQDTTTKANTILENLYNLSAVLERTDSPNETSWAKEFLADQVNIAEQEQRRKFATYARDHLLEHMDSIVLRPLLETETIKDVKANARPSADENTQGFLASPRFRLEKLVLVRQNQIKSLEVHVIGFLFVSE
ncbi:hypothetical protein IQ07DRAFT_313327 [Pyrenochaeta sp. DS3sAY3a]|nr:hypothetical protein IQ07DRAFT_313327 [Pyrenochaeta sp. DS3sAY3a]